MKPVLLAAATLTASTLPVASAQAATLITGDDGHTFTIGDKGEPSIDHTAEVFAGNSRSKKWILPGAANHGFSGIATASPHGVGGPDISLVPARQNAVPEPATWTLMIGGYLLVGAAMRYRGRTLNAGYY